MGIEADLPFGVEAMEEEITFNTDEAAARFYLEQLFAEDEHPEINALTAPEDAKVVPDLRLIETYAVAPTETTVLRFQQESGKIPVFGTRAVVELDRDRRARSVAAELANVPDQNALATISPSEARDRLAAALKVDPADLAGLGAPQLTWFEDVKKHRWHLAYLFLGVPGREHPKALDHGMAPSPRSTSPRSNVLMAATGDGRQLYSYPADPTLAELPVECHGLDEIDQDVHFWGRAVNGSFLLEDPQRKAQTFDLAFGDLATAQPPTTAISSTTTNWGDSQRAAISAHFNAARVLDFYNAVLMRDGVDGRQMPLISLVNCRYRPVGASQEWANAVWFKDRMWYGQRMDAGLGRLASYSRFLDVIAHELTHGVTQSTCNLVYRDQSGALNESMSDIFGVIIANWDRHSDDGGKVDAWTWIIGAGLSRTGGPLRDMSDPASLGMPDHMKDYSTTTADNGGVHTNSNIHNKAAFLVLTASDAQGRVFTPIDVARLYYWTLQRLNDRATFDKVLLELIDVVSSVNAGDPATRDRKIAAIRAAYGAVGIVA